MKIGIITFHRAHNYGAVLQCYALTAVLKRLGCQVEVVDYYPKYLRSQYGLLPSIKIGVFLWVKHLIKTLCILKVSIKRLQLFNSFIKSLPLSAHQYDENDTEITGYDVLLFGSDQIWNPLLTQGIDKVFSGFFSSDNTRFVSYAASTNPKICTEEYRTYFERILQSFDSISVREKSLANYLNGLKPYSTVTVLDPVLLLSKEDWSSIAITPPEKKYLLIYTVPQSPLVRKRAVYIARLMGLQIIELTSSAKNVKGKEYRQSIGPCHFLGYFQNASYIVTTSFHGTAFALKFERQFSNISLGTSADDRACNLLESVDLKRAIISNDNLYEEPCVINYSEITRRLDQHINKSITFIQESVGLNTVERL